MLRRAVACASAALRDFRQFQGGALKDERRAQQLIDLVEKVLAKEEP